jgi:hypothetical protein
LAICEFLSIFELELYGIYLLLRLYADIFVNFMLSWHFSKCLSMFFELQACDATDSGAADVRRHCGWRGRGAAPGSMARQRRQLRQAAARQRRQRRHPPWRGKAAAPPSVARQAWSSKNMLNIMVKIMLKLEITNISENKLKIK